MGLRPGGEQRGPLRVSKMRKFDSCASSYVSSDVICHRPIALEGGTAKKGKGCDGDRRRLPTSRMRPGKTAKMLIAEVLNLHVTKHGKRAVAT
jgi:hypothetical protein